ncbi:CRASP family complement regulator-acquiring lipoprotein [Borrelia crocidurae]|uniref:CRASP family complement regulator-acquiring lipoprotein n=1 Tax=Borrelia crocidurae TaxID=29520 RepID=UPI00046D1D64|nr:CRASP family complement regulator-acquiring lipoprotein [Borrelia crocidurae]
MKQKVFVIFVLISLLLIACDPREKTFDYAEAKRIQKEKVEQIRKAEEQRIREAEEQMKQAEKAKQLRIIREDADQLERERAYRRQKAEKEEKKAREQAEEIRKQKLEEEEEERLKQQEISVIKKNITSEISRILKMHNKSFNESEEFLSVGDIRFAFSKLSYTTVDGRAFLYDGTTPNSDADISKAARREVYLCFGYNVGLLKVAAFVFGQLYWLPGSMGLLARVLQNARECARAYYVDVYDFLEKNLGKLNTLSVGYLKLLKVRFKALADEELELRKYFKREDLSALTKLNNAHVIFKGVIEQADLVKDILYEVKEESITN